MDFDRIITSVPINRTAAVVAGGANDHDDETPETRRRNLVKLVQQIDRAIQICKEPERKKWLGQRKFEVQTRLKDTPRKFEKGRSLSDLIVDVAKERMSKGQFAMLVDEANRRFSALQTNEETEDSTQRTPR